MPFTLLAVLVLTLIVIVFLGYAHADDRARHERDKNC